MKDLIPIESAWRDAWNDLSLRDLPGIDYADERDLDRSITSTQIVGAAVGWILATVVMLPVQISASTARQVAPWPGGLAVLVVGKLVAAWALLVLASRWSSKGQDAE